MEEQRPHPRSVMNDITGVSSTNELERVNTMTITKDIEARSKTLGFTLLGFLCGLVLCVIVASLTNYMIGAFFALLCTVAFPYVMVGQVRDITQQVRWKRALSLMRSRKVEGGIFYANSTSAENIVDIQELDVL